MVIQGTQVPMYTNTHCFYIFLIFQFFNFFIWKKKDKINQNYKKKKTKNKTKNKKQNKKKKTKTKTKPKTSYTKQCIKENLLKTRKQNTQVMQK